jgi:hypothetical protein
MLQIPITSPVRKPWTARLNGVEWYSPREYDQDGNIIVVPARRRFSRSFVGSSVNLSAKDTYTVEIYNSGIYEIRPFPGSSLYIVFDGLTHKQTTTVFPNNWTTFMRETGIDYEGVWARAWDKLSALRDELAESEGVR